MESIQDSGWPLVFAVNPTSFSSNRISGADQQLQIRTSTRSLEGMQKEAVVEYGQGGRIWRMVCDEGPYLNGTDLAPFPLGFFATGLAASYMSAFLAEAKSRGIAIGSLSITVDNLYAMDGSALKGTMAADVLPTTVALSATGDTSDDELRDIAEIAVAERSPGNAVLNSALASAFAIRSNDEMLEHSLPVAKACLPLADPRGGFDKLQPATAAADLEIIRKAEQVADSSPSGSSIGLKADQKRTVHVQATGHLRADGLKEITSRCVTPASSAFTFLSDDSRLFGGQERAPSGLAYLSAGVAFCFMTQLGRYAQIAKQKLSGYGVVQDTAFDVHAEYEPSADAVQTLVCIDADEPAENIRKLVQMGEQTCYLHGAYRLANETQLK